MSELIVILVVTMSVSIVKICVLLLTRGLEILRPAGLNLPRLYRDRAVSLSLPLQYFLLCRHIRGMARKCIGPPALPKV